MFLAAINRKQYGAAGIASRSYFETFEGTEGAIIVHAQGVEHMWQTSPTKANDSHNDNEESN